MRNVLVPPITAPVAPAADLVRTLGPASLGRAIRLTSAVRSPWVEIDLPLRARQSDADIVAAKDECIAIVAHELRNALGPIGLAAELLNTPGVPASASEKARDIITRQIEHMTRLIDDLLDGARITQGKMDVRLAPIDLTPVLRQTREVMDQQVGQRGQRVALSLPPEPLYVLGDVARLQQAFGNLLSNASKYTKQGGQIWLSANKTIAADGSEEIVVRIRDEGIGIAADLLPRVFDLFKQAGRSPHDVPGLGVGLALVRSVIDLHGGRVIAQSAGLDRGTVLIVSLPILKELASPVQPVVRSAVG
jgi:signal transduction histidine kinase